MPDPQEKLTPEQLVKNAHILTQAVDRLAGENIRMREVLLWLDRRGGLGYEAHDRIKSVLEITSG